MDDIEPEGEQTPEQAENLAVDSFLYACSLSDVEPLEETVPAILRRRKQGSIHSFDTRATVVREHPAVQ